MNVGDLQQHLANLSAWLTAAGVKGNPQPDLRAVIEGLTPFREHGLKDFADFLVKAEAFARTGELPVKGGSRRAGAGWPAKVAAADVSHLTEETLRIYQQAADPAVTKEQIEALMAHLSKLTKDGLLGIAASLGLRLPKSVTKAKIVEEMQKRIWDRKSIYQRTGLIKPNDSAANRQDHAMSQTPSGAPID